MGYIDAEKLKELLEAKYKEYADNSKKTYAALQYQYIADGIDIAKQIVDSLQQEQEQRVIGGQVFGATDVEQLYKGKVYIVSKLVQDKEFGIEPREQVKMLLIKD